MPLGIDFTQILLHFFNVIILFVGLYVLLYAPVKKFMAKRSDYYADLDSKTKQALEEAEAKKAAYDEKLAAAEKEIEEQRKAANDEISALKKEQTEAARAEAKKIVADAREKAEKQRALIVSGAKEDISRMIETAARKVMAGEASGDPYEDFIRDAERSRANGHS
ncbi:MAG: ATP synthase F0 subunit B [Lachnospiraceae bacterium]|nr:ATP synthase F0 subunit B [Lachnospiraceae bacterium]